MKNWILLDQTNKTLLDEHSALLNLILNQIGIEDKESAEKFLNPNAKNIESPYNFYQIESTAQKILELVHQKKKIFIHGDYDVDGIVATSILWDFLYRKLGANVLPIVPNRFDDGYGLSTNTLDKISSQGGEVVITVDCGIKDNDTIKKYSNLQFIITDHHSFAKDENGEFIIPNAENIVGIVHPLDARGNVQFQKICGATVVWKLIQVLTKISNINFDPFEYIDLVALATSTDIMPLIGDNRIIISEGIKFIRATQNPSIKAIIDVAGINQSEINEYDFGYVIGPRLNAAGRVDDAMQAVRLLSTNDMKKANQLANVLNDLNIERQRITQELLDEAFKQADSKQSKLIAVWGKDWPEGIIGLVAGRLNEKYSRPSIVCSINSTTKQVVGSGRSPETFDITTALSSQSELLLRYGGHVQAAGFQLEEESFEKFISSMENYVEQNMSDEDTIATLKINSKLTLSDLNTDLVEEIKLLEPFGFANPKPKFWFENLEVLDVKLIGKDKRHLKIYAKDSNNKRIDCIGFGLGDSFDSIQIGDKIDIVGSVGTNEWNNRIHIQIEIKDFKKIN